MSSMKVMRRCITNGHQFGWQSIRTYASDTTINRDQDYYNILGVTPNCPKTRIKVAYYKLSKKYHPDVNKTDEAKVMFQEISEAYDILSNPITRNEYDRSRASVSPGYRNPSRHGQERYKPRGVIYPTGRSTTYNFDEWHSNHYRSTMERNWHQKSTRESETVIRDRHSYYQSNEGMANSKDGMNIFFFTMAFLGMGCVYYYLDLNMKEKTVQKHAVQKKTS